MLTSNDKKLLIELLERYDDELSDRGCNDYSLSATKDNIALVSELEDLPEEDVYIYEDETGPGTIMTMDFLIVEYLIKKLKD